jgi:FMN phosphatase YigB (HAD superfamily)
MGAMRPDAFVFDLGNTLAPWGPVHTMRLYAAIRGVLEDALGPIDDFDLRAFRAREEFIVERESGSMREVTVREFVERMAGGSPPPSLESSVARAMHEHFVALCRVPERTAGTIRALAKERPLAVLSNFLLARPVEEVIERAGIRDCFVHVEVSATGGFMKPHPAPFDAVLQRLGTPRERTMMVGDNVWADIVGGHRAGLLTALTREFAGGPTTDPRAPGIAPDLVLESLDALRDRPA